jgi:LysM repeat protein
MATHTIQVTIDDGAYQIATNRATSEGKSVGQVVAEFLLQFADGASAGVPTSYTVQRGDTLGRIAARFYGDASKYPIIQRANNISSPNRIWVGQVLVIPPMAGITPSQPVVTPTPAPATPAPVVTPAPAPAPVTPPAAGGPPGKPSIRWVGSPNFNNRRRPDDITAIVMHSTANSSLDRVVDWFNNPSAQVSAHYTIGKDGEIVQHVQDMHRAWHAGRSVWKGRESVNDFGIGIEMVNLNDGHDPYPETQHQAAVALCAWLCDKYSISVDDIMGHVDIAIPPGRKSDPRAYDQDRLRRDVAAVLGHR